MASAIDPGKFIDGVPVSKADLRAQFQIAQQEITALQNSVTILQDQVASLLGNAPVPIDAPISSGLLTIDLSAGVYFDCLLTENITSIEITGAQPTAVHDFRLRLRQSNASSFTVAWSGTVNGSAATFSWAVSAPTMTPTLSKYDMIGLRIFPNEPAKVFGFIEAQGRT